MKTQALALLFALAPLPTAAGEPVVTLRATVTGNQEQPRVMYILPWQQAGAVKFDEQPGADLAGDLFNRIDRDEYLRELGYREMLARETGGKTAHN